MEIFFLEKAYLLLNAQKQVVVGMSKFGFVSISQQGEKAHGTF
jgi:hypothetical protein